jgi:hypothetical protein
LSRLEEDEECEEWLSLRERLPPPEERLEEEEEGMLVLCLTVCLLFQGGVDVVFALAFGTHIDFFPQNAPQKCTVRTLTRRC